MSRRPGATSRAADALLDARELALQTGNAALISHIDTSLVEIEALQFGLDMTAYQLQQGIWPEPPTPWFQRRERQLGQLIDLEDERQRRRGAA